MNPAITTTEPRVGIIVFAHGSRDALWRDPVEAVGAAIARGQSAQSNIGVRCAYLELCEPSLADAAASLIADGAQSLRIFPMFFGVGKHAREDLPELLAQLRSAHPEVPMILLPAAGEYAQVITLLAQIALAGDASGGQPGA